jgi:hypothetical protein
MIDAAPPQAIQNVGPLFHFAQKNTTPIRGPAMIAGGRVDPILSHHAPAKHGLRARGSDTPGDAPRAHRFTEPPHVRPRWVSLPWLRRSLKQPRDSWNATALDYAPPAADDTVYFPHGLPVSALRSAGALMTVD